MPTCGKCKLDFNTCKEYSKHQKRCIVGLSDSVTITIPELGQITVQMNEQNNYQCHCTVGGCSKEGGFSTLEGLKKHLRKRKTWVNPSNVSHW
ncbi:hypothetical protein JVU11DRAFT_10902 [Chiua virens]|nr:hypothetical protein JVU11DRAFT_10902 [Chiua virens]